MRVLFFRVKTPEEVLELLNVFEPVKPETVSIAEGLDRALSQEIIAEEDLPGFARSAMDGYAVRAKDTFGASESIPVLLEVAGEVIMGQAPSDIITPGKALKIATGGMIPEGSDAVVMLEYCRSLDEKTIEVNRTVSHLENIIGPGDDLEKGVVIFERGSVLRPQDIGLLAGLGIRHVGVHKRPKVGIISTGDEIVPIERKPGPGQVRDINSYTLSAFCRRAGAMPVDLGLCKDSFSDLKERTVAALDASDTVWISGGSSVGARDLTRKVLESFDKMEVLVHGIAISPGKPTILARIGNKAVFGLPGHVASAMVIAEVFLNPFLARISGEAHAPQDNHCYQEAELERNIESASGRDDYIRVKLVKRNGRFFAEPIFGKSGLLSTMAQADGLLKIDRNTEGLYKGQAVRVMLFYPLRGRV